MTQARKIKSIQKRAIKWILSSWNKYVIKCKKVDLFPMSDLNDLLFLYKVIYDSLMPNNLAK